MNKGIIILGAPASGKSYLEEEIYNHLYNIKYKHEFRVNPDFYVEDEDSEFYNNPLAASSYVYKTIIPEIIELNSNFILQNTGANLKTLRKITDTPNYQFKAMIVYCNPIIAFIRNFSRQRKLPKQVLLETWLKVYSQIDDYINMFGKDNIYTYETEYTEQEQKIIYDNNFNVSIKKYLSDCDVSSSFRKEHTTYTELQIQEKQIKWDYLLGKIDNELWNIEKKLFDDYIDKYKEEFIQDLKEWI